MPSRTCKLYFVCDNVTGKLGLKFKAGLGQSWNYMDLLFKRIYVYIYIDILHFGNLGTNVASESI